MASFSDLPKDLVEEIMSRLPPNSLGRAKCVSKSWNTLVSGFMNDPEFVARHLHNMKNNPSALFVFGGYGRGFSLLTLFDDDSSEGSARGTRGVIEGVHLPLRQEKDSVEIRVYHCDGILCLVKNSRTVMLCNPAIQEFKVLPKSNIEATEEFCSVDIGFGYDSREKDYKVVRIWYYLDCDDDDVDIDDFKYVRAEIYTLRTDSWREIDVNLGDICPYRWEPLYWRGVCYWLVLDGEDYSILCFDMCNEEFHMLPGPDGNWLSTNWSGLFVWNDFPALFLCSKDYSLSSGSGTDDEDDHVDPLPLSFDIYVMDNDCDVGGVKRACSWTNSVYTVTPPTSIHRVLTPWNSDEVLMINFEAQLLSYNLHTKKFRNIAVHSPFGREFSACNYVKSLVSVRGR